MALDNTEKLIQAFSEEYNSDSSVRKYASGTAGYGIDYLLRHDYAELYLTLIEDYLLSPSRTPLRLLEFGCGAGMNLIRLLALLEEKGIPVASAYGTDFSESLIHTARNEAASLLSHTYKGKVGFHVARNEMLVADLAAAVDVSEASLLGSFDFILGVNTSRYCHRLGKEQESARDILSLLRQGGICIIIDMNRDFPLFRSRLGVAAKDDAEHYLPSLDEYASPFAAAGFEILRMENFCWIAHSAGPALTYFCLLLAPLLNLFARRYAMRSLVVARKPMRETHPIHLAKR